MKNSALFTSLATLLHLVIIDGVFILFRENPAANYMVVISYNIIWLIAALLVWNQSYAASNSNAND
ncbi:hypothetical protein SAMN04487764_1998 [Gillisia sp. Hel1_33_143]|uniref:hypothetical protein n=1 Tax=unclassified Gillisia TaxID=2615025 RepID=UPI000556FE8A|nr:MULTISPECIES: hypothetical protein [unclassified Gillisia]SDS34151.1 hypothetical protein SAMN04487764_1998 [Gillisia sp. Hel1_33_143]